MDPFSFLLVIIFVWGPSMGQEPNSRCYLVDHEMRQARPCRWEESR